MLKYILGFVVYYLIGFFYVLFIPGTDRQFEGYFLGVSFLAFFWPPILLMRILGYIRILFEVLINKAGKK